MCLVRSGQGLGVQPRRVAAHTRDSARCTAALAVGTFILVFSNTYYYQNVALMLTPIIVVALLLDLLFLPPLLVKLDRLLDGRSTAKAEVEGEPASTPTESS